MQVEDWLRSHGLEKFAALFAEHEIGLDILGTLTGADLRELGLPLGARKRMLRAIADFNETAMPAAPVAATAPAPKADEGERRQITVLFCDLVDFTGLATAMDPEDLEALIARFVETCRAEVARWGGHVGNYLGDGLLVYFGWPQAFEDAPQRAAHASLALVRAAGRLRAPSGRPLQVRVGMATGLVLAGRKLDSGSGQLDTVFGKTPNLAARLEALAQPGEVLIDRATAALLPEPRFAMTDLGAHLVKGFTTAVDVVRLDGASVQSSPSRARSARLGEAPIEGRDGPMALLAGWWREAQSGQGLRIVALEGEAGIGKSHVSAHFLRACRNDGGQGHELQCWPYNDNATLYPIVAWLYERAGVMPDAPVEMRRTAFAGLAARQELPRDVYLSGLGDLLDLDPALLVQSSELRRAAWFGAIARILRADCAVAPMALVLEDMHWTDPLTDHLLADLAVTAADLPLMILSTARPQASPRWADLPPVRRIELTRVGRRAAERMVTQLSVGLTAEVRERIVEASDGVPLFVSELTRDIIKRAREGSGDAAALTIPATLQGVLAARLESARDARPVAQVASCIGRVFDPGVLGRVMGRDMADLAPMLDTLETLALIEPIEAEDRRYIFRHALIQEAAYQSQPKSRRRAIHGAIADALALSPTADDRVLANHLTAAERYSEAVERWKGAGLRAARRSAQGEAIEHFRRGLGLLEKLPAGHDRDARRLAMLLALGPVLSSHDGYGAETVGALYVEAAALADTAGQQAERFAVRRGLWMYRQMSAQYPAAEQVAQDMLALTGGAAPNAALSLEAHRALGATAFMLGNLREARRSLETAIDGYARGAGAGNIALFGDDPGLGCMAYLSSCLWYLGEPEAALRCCDEMLSIARRIEHPFSLARSLTFSAYTYHLMQDFDRLLPTAEEAAVHAQRFEFPFHEGVGRILWGWGLCKLRDHDRGRGLIDAGFDRYDASGSFMLRPLYLTLRAELAAESGRPSEAWALSQRSRDGLERSQENLVRSEVLRVQGELLAQRGETAEGLRHIDQAIAVAEAQASVFCALRAHVSAVRIDPDRAPALARALAGFPAGLASPDIAAAQRALAASQRQTT
ncbi:adenylate/guanylate cyclase domain-containing protein [Marinovum sp.]|uniref:adenylate/guanylate cyclase domain-containing protein n=1 Tax=Marinovum sp. TaxID=2024839 RepID=UPI002B27756A|nr:adenylate/guanylate cyclase domain-containing protein [Marinovum sp.]